MAFNVMIVWLWMILIISTAHQGHPDSDAIVLPSVWYGRSRCYGACLIYWPHWLISCHSEGTHRVSPAADGIFLCLNATFAERMDHRRKMSYLFAEGNRSDFSANDLRRNRIFPDSVCQKYDTGFRFADTQKQTDRILI